MRDAVDQAEPAVGQPEQAGRVALAGVGLGRGQKRPGLAVVVRGVSVDPALGLVEPPDGRHEVGRRQRTVEGMMA